MKKPEDRPNPWPAVAAVPGLMGLPATWRAVLGEDFPAFCGFLQASPRLAGCFPCPRQCGCAHDIVRHPGGPIVAVCRCDPWNCDDLELPHAEVALHQLNWPKLGRALCQALGQEPKSAPLALPRTAQIGAYSTANVPVILTIETERPAFGRVVAELAARLRQPFILLAASSSPLDAAGQEILAGAGAGFFPLDTCVRLAPHGVLQPVKSPGELFARFRPEPGESVDEDTARKAFALVEQLDSAPLKPPSVLTVFRLYCLQNMSAAQVARQCACSKTSVMRRLELIREKTGAAPAALRRLSPHLEKLEEDIADSRARHIQRGRLVE